MSVGAFAGCLLGCTEGDLDRRTTGHEFVERFDDVVGRPVPRHGPRSPWPWSPMVRLIRVHAARSTALPPARAQGSALQNTGMSVLSGSPDEEPVLGTWHAEPLGGAASEGMTAHDVMSNAP